jgi:hypothetical protein
MYDIISLLGKLGSQVPTPLTSIVRPWAVAVMIPAIMAFRLAAFAGIDHTGSVAQAGIAVRVLAFMISADDPLEGIA